MAFYESLGRVSGHFHAPRFQHAGIACRRSRTRFICSWPASDYDWDRVPADLSRELEAFLARGNRLVITFFPQTSAYAIRNAG